MPLITKDAAICDSGLVETIWWAASPQISTDEMPYKFANRHANLQTRVQIWKTWCKSTPGTTYVFQARAVTQDGYSNWGDPIARIAV